MRRIGRYIFNGLTVLSVLLCLATVALWLRSYATEDVLVRDPGGPGRLVAFASRGRLRLALIDIAAQYRQFAHALKRSNWARPGWSYDKLDPQSDFPGLGHPATNLQFFGFGYQRGIGEGVWDCRFLTVPMWAVVLATAWLPVLRLRVRRLARRRSRDGCCAACGYDLRATPEQCPECGKVAKVRA